MYNSETAEVAVQGGFSWPPFMEPKQALVENPRLVGLCGNSGSGKSAVLKILQQRGWVEIRCYDSAWPAYRAYLNCVITGVSSEEQASAIRRLGGEVWHILRAEGGPKLCITKGDVMLYNTDHFQDLVTQVEAVLEMTE